MKKKLANLISIGMIVMFVLFSTVNAFAYNTSAISTGDSTTIVIVTLAIILVAAIIAILLLSRKK